MHNWHRLRANLSDEGCLIKAVPVSLHLPMVLNCIGIVHLSYHLSDFVPGCAGQFSWYPRAVDGSFPCLSTSSPPTCLVELDLNRTCLELHPPTTNNLSGTVLDVVNRCHP